MKKFIAYFSSILLIYIITLLLYLSINNSLIFPSPNIIIKNTFILLGKGKTYLIIISTIKRLVISLLISFLIGMILGILAGLNKYLEIILKPLMTILRTIPLASIILLIIMITGMAKSPYVICSLMIIPVVYEAFLRGIKNIDKEINDVWKIDSKMNFLIIKKVLIPTIIPFIITAYIQSIGLGLKVLVMSEFLAQTKNSIGKELVSASNNIEYNIVLAWTLILIVLVIIIEIIPKIIYDFKKKNIYIK